MLLHEDQSKQKKSDFNQKLDEISEINDKHGTLETKGIKMVMAKS